MFINPVYLTTSTPIECSMTSAPVPCTIKLHVTAGDTLVLEQSLDGLEYEPAITTATANYATVLISGCNKIRVTRSAGTSATSYFSVC